MPFITQGKTNLKYILIVAILAAIIGGGILVWQYWWTEEPSERTAEEETFKEYSNLFYSFKYPSYYEISSERIEAEHKKNASGYDVYGLTSIRMEGKIGSLVYSIDISSLPNWSNISFSEALKEEQEAFEKFEKSHDDDTIETVVIAGKDAIRKFRPYFKAEGSGRPGSETVTFITEDYSYGFMMLWIGPAGNDPNHKTRADFQKLLQSFTINTQ